jgi:hypothetical protein
VSFTKPNKQVTYKPPLVGQSGPNVEGGVVNGYTHLIYLDLVWETAVGRDSNREAENIGYCL